MEPGSLGAGTLPIASGARWYRSRSMLAFGGEPVGSFGLLGMTWVDGVRCRGCHLLLLHY